MVALHRLHSDIHPILPDKLSSEVQGFVTLYQSSLPFYTWDTLPAELSIEQVVYVDTQEVADLPEEYKDLPVWILDHHPLERTLRADDSAEIETVGAITTLLVEKMRAAGLELDSFEATLMALGIYSDTGRFTYNHTTSRDFEAVSWLVSQGLDFDQLDKLLTQPMTEDQQQLFEMLLQNIEARQVAGMTIHLATTTVDRQIRGISTVTEQLQRILDPLALVVLVAMPESIQMVGRSQTDSISVGRLAGHFGGGGHPRAAARDAVTQNRTEQVDRPGAAMAG